ncbi:MAG: dTDP-4-dehydrorhamnose 3,5-epimerase family protein [Candidatus Eisenbacteria bacterium]
MPTIEGVAIKQLKVIPDERGFLMEMLRSDDPIFRKFGQVYLSVAYPGIVKGWHYHKLQTDYFTVVKGMLKVVLFDRRENSKTHGVLSEFFMGERNPILLVIPPLVVHGVKAVGPEPGYLVNCPDMPYNHASPDEYRIDPHGGEIPYDWKPREG